MEHLRWTLLWLVDHVIKYILLKRHIFQFHWLLGCKEHNKYRFNDVLKVSPRLKLITWSNKTQNFTRNTICTTQNSEKKKWHRFFFWVGNTQSSTHPSPAAERRALDYIHIPSMFPALLGSWLTTVIWGRTSSLALWLLGN